MYQPDPSGLISKLVSIIDALFPIKKFLCSYAD